MTKKLNLAARISSVRAAPAQAKLNSGVTFLVRGIRMPPDSDGKYPQGKLYFRASRDVHKRRTEQDIRIVIQKTRTSSAHIRILFENRWFFVQVLPGYDGPEIQMGIVTTVTDEEARIGTGGWGFPASKGLGADYNDMRRFDWQGLE
jgi:hypothetical protein